MPARQRTWVRAAIAAMLFASAAPKGARAADAIPMPAVVIYPGDTITDGMLIDKLESQAGDGAALVVRQRAQLVGKVARQTLLPGRAIPIASIANPRLVMNGSEVRIVYSEGPLLIATTGIALQDGALGAAIKVRNGDSGRTIVGTVLSDGSIGVGGS